MAYYDKLLGKLRDGDTGGESSVIWDYSQVTYPVVYGDKRYLDAMFPELIFTAEQNGVTGFRAYVISNDNTVSGDIVLIPIVATNDQFTDATELPAKILAVGTSLSEISFDLEVNQKYLKFERRYSDERDTLKDGDGAPITAIVFDLARRISNA